MSKKIAALTHKTLRIFMAVVMSLMLIPAGAYQALATGDDATAPNASEQAESSNSESAATTSESESVTTSSEATIVTDEAVSSSTTGESAQTSQTSEAAAVAPESDPADDDTATTPMATPYFKIVVGSTTTVYDTLADAIAAANTATTADGAKIQAINDYSETAADAAVAVTNTTVPVVITTASGSDATYPYTGSAADGHAVITRSFTGASMFTLSSGELDFANVTIDGNKASYHSTESGGIVHATGGTLAMKSGSTFENSLTDLSATGNPSAGGAVYLSGSGTKMTMADGAVGKNCETPSVYGGFLFQSANTTFEATGGSITGCKTTHEHGSGGAIMQAPGEANVTTILGGTFSGSSCSSPSNGSFIHGGGSGSVILIKDSASITDCTGAGAAYIGGAIYPYNATVQVQDSATASGSLQVNGTAMNFYTSGVSSLAVTGNMTGGAFYVYGANGFQQAGQQFGTTTAANASSVTGLYNLKNDRDATLVGAAGGTTGNKVVWTTTDDTITFDKNATDATGTMADETVTYGTDTTLTANGYTRAGYEFAGWNTAADGTGTSYADGATSKEFTNVYDSTTGKLATVTLYAQWNIDTYDNVFIGSTTAVNNSSGIAASDSNSGTSPSTAVATFAKAKSLLKPGGTIWIVGPVDVTGAETWDLANYGTSSSGPGLMKRWDGTSVTFTAAADTAANSKRSLVNETSGDSLTVTNLTIDGSNINVAGILGNGAIFYLTSAGLTLGTGSTVQNALRKQANYGDRGGAVFASGASTVAMNDDAAIRSCTASFGAGVWLQDTSTLTMSGTSTMDSCKGCGMTTTIRGGIVSFKDSTSVSMTDDSSIANSLDSGLSGGSDIIVSWGQSTGSVNMSGNAKIDNSYGRGVRLFSGNSLTMSDNAAISGCKNSSGITTGDAYGIYLNTGATATISGAAAVSNNALAGVYVADSATLTMNGGTVSGNTASGVVLVTANSTMNVSGSATVSGNTLKGATSNIVSEAANGKINVTGVLTGAMGVSVFNKTVSTTNHKPLYEFAQGSGGYMVVATDASCFTDDYAQKLDIELTPGSTVTPADGTDNTIRFGKVENVYIGSTSASYNSALTPASDNNDGTTPSTPVATFAKAKSMLKEGGTIWVVGPVAVNDVENWSLAGYGAGGIGAGIMKRWDGTSAADLAGDAYTGNNAKACTRDMVQIGSTGVLTAGDITLDGGWKNASGTEVLSQQGTIFQNASGGSVTIGSGTTLQNNYCTKTTNTAGAAYNVGTTSKFTMEEGSLITGCRAQYGGGLTTFGGAITMNGGMITDCSSTRAGGDSPGAVEVYQNGSFTMNDGVITNCSNLGTTVSNAGGAVFVEQGTAYLYGGSIHDNYGHGVGGGVYRNSVSGIILSGNITITDNFGGCTFDSNGNLLTTGSRSDLYTNGSGSYVKITGPLTGEIGINEYYSYHIALREFATGGTTVSGGTAYTVTDDDAAVFYDDYVNQFGIENYSTHDAVRFKGYTITYNKNGDGAGGDGSVTGNVPVDTVAHAIGDAVTLKTKNTLVYPGHTFVGWAVNAADTTATAGAAGAQYVFPGTWAKTSDPGANITLYAVWTENSNYTVKYNTEGSTSPTSYTDKTPVSWTQANLLPGTPEKTGYTFDGWYNTSDKTGMQVTDTTKYGDIAANDTNTSTTIYAVWTATTITGANKVITESTAKASTVDDAQVIAWNAVAGTVDGTTATPVVTGDNTGAYTAIKAGTDGTYTFTYQEGTGSAAKTATYTITVVPDGSTIVDAHADAAYAGIYIVGSTAAKSLSKTDLYVDQNDYAAYQGQAIAAADMPGAHVTQVIADTDWSKIAAGTLGSYNSNITSGTATSAGGKVIVVSDETVISDDDAVFAQNTILTESDAKALTASTQLYGSGLDTAATRIYNNVSGYVDGVLGTETTITQAFTSPTAWTSITAGTLGTYEVTYTAGSATKTVTVSVVPDGSTVGPSTDGDDAIYSKTVLMKSQTVKDFVTAGTLDNPRDLMIPEFNDVHAVKDGQTIADPIADETDVTQTFINGDWNKIRSGTVGSYSVTYACGDAAPQKVRVIIVKDSAHVYGLNDAIIADSVTITSSTATALEPRNLYEQNYNYVVGYYRDAIGDDIIMVPNNDPNIETLIPQTIVGDWASLHAGTTGTYDVMYQIQDLNDKSFTSITPTVTVVPDDSTIVANTGDAVWTHSYITTSDEAIADFEGHDPDMLYGTSTATGTSTEYNQVLIDQNNVILTDGSSPSRKAASTQTIAAADWTSIQAGDQGQYDVTYAVIKKASSPTATDASQTAHVIIMPNGSDIDQGNGAAVHASTVTITASQAKALTSQSALYGTTYNNVVASKNGSLVSTGDLAATLTQTIASADWTNITGGITGSYNVTYAVPGSTASTTVQVIVVPDETTIDPATNDTVTAYSTVMNSTSAQGLIGKTDLYGSSYNNVSGNIAGVAIPSGDVTTNISQTFANGEADWTAINENGTVGTYKVTYETNNNSAASRQVNVVVVPDGSDIEGNNSAYEGVKIYTQTEAMALTDKTTLYADQGANATANATAFTTTQMADGDLIDGCQVRQTIADSSWSSIQAGTLGKYTSNIQVVDTTNNDTVLATSTTGYVIVVPDKAVVDPTTADAVMATDCIMDQTTAKGLSGAEELYGGGAGLYNQVWGAIAGVPVATADLTTEISLTFAETTDWNSIHTGTMGAYSVTYETNDNANASETVLVTVVHDGSDIEGFDAAWAGTKIYTQTEARAVAAKADLFSAQSMSMFYQGASVGTTDPHVSLTITDSDFASIQAGTVGEYDSNVTSGAATSTTGKVIVVHDGAVVDPTTTTSVYAQSVTLTPAQAQALTAANDLYGQTVNAVSGYIDGVAIDDASLTSNVSQSFADNDAWTSIQAGYLGDYEVTYSVTSAADPSKTVSKTVHVIIADHGSNNDGVTCAGNDFMISKSDAANATDDTIRGLASAVGYDTATDTGLVPAVADRGGLTGTVGTYQIKFTATSPTNIAASATVTATVKDHVTNDGGEAIGGNDFIISEDDATSIIGGDTAMAIADGSVTARNTVTGEALDIATVDASALSTTPGSYPVTYATANGTSVTLMATVKGDNTVVDPLADEAIDANDLTVTVQEAAQLLTDSAITTATGAHAWKLSDGSSVAIATVDNGVLAAPGTYQVSFATAAGTATTITVTVTGSQTPTAIDPPVTKTVTGEAPAASYEFTMKAITNDAPMPSGSTAGVETVSIDLAAGAQDAVSVEFGTITYNSIGTYVYKITETIGTDTNMAYDKTEYTMTVKVVDNGDGTLGAIKTITKQDGSTADSAAFNNVYTQPSQPVQPSQPSQPGSSTSKSELPKTGDGSTLPLCVAIAAVSVGCACITALRRRRRDEK